MSISKMVCPSEEATAECIVQDMLGTSSQGKTSIYVHPSTFVHELINDVALKYNYDEDEFQLIYQSMRIGDQTEVVLNDSKQKTLSDVGINFEEGARNWLCISSPPRSKYSNRRKTAIVNDSNEDDLLLGASASPTMGDLLTPLRMHNDCIGDSLAGTSSYNNSSLIKRASIGYLGLVNQAMTCYLNSLLQALFMTPEFRNALYNWEFDGKDEVNSIPYQLQKLFLNLQTSTKVAVETTQLTRSFGWDSSEAWQQHDIQELCRVMFDALEQKFKNTKQADLINRLYEGKLFDYVKCLECGTEKSREDTFLDIPLPVRPFGSAIAYGSVEEALRAFVKPETLDGVNQYYCEKCSKKCDAHKGLKFTKFPYLLTLHLKRFDFDYSTLHRIKLNDKVSFPETLNLNSFILSAANKEEVDLDETVVRYDDSSTTDSGSALDEDSCQGTDITAPNSNNVDMDYPDFDEGIDVSEGTSNNHQENEKNKRFAAEPGPYMYELFSIMIHSGSASGGHYYAYIKDFKKGEWFCFNDQSVTKITYDDIRKTYGGGHMRGYYSGAFSSSTNAYMLMYRQIDKERNCDAMTVDDFPPHIKELYQNIKAKEDSERVFRENEIKQCRLNVYVNHPRKNLIDKRVMLDKDCTLAEATYIVRNKFGLEDIVPLEQCRLVAYDPTYGTIECSFEGQEKETIGAQIINLRRRPCKNEFLLEIRGKNEKFKEYQPGILSLKVYVVDIETELVEGPEIVRINQSQTVKELKKAVAKALDLNASTLILGLEEVRSYPKILEDNRTLESEGMYTSHKLYAAKVNDTNLTKQLIISKFNQIIDQFEHVISLQFVLPEVDEEILKSMGIPALDLTQTAVPTVDQKEVINQKEITIQKEKPATRDVEMQVCESIPIVPPKVAVPVLPQSDSPILQRASPLPVEVGSDQSNSEDSSLSDSDRTLVGDLGAPDDEGLAQLSVSSMSPCVSSPDEAKKIEDSWDELQLINSYLKKKRLQHYFKVTELIRENKKTVILKALIDNRMVLGEVKKELEPYVGVPMDYFRVYNNIDILAYESEAVRLNENFLAYRNGQKIGIRLGRALGDGEYKGKVYQLIPDEPIEPIKYLCDWIIGMDARVADVKKGIHEELKRKGLLDVPYDRFRLRKKNWKHTGKVYLDDEKLDINPSSNWEIFVQELTEPEIVQNSDQIIVFVRHWCPSTMELKGFKEIVLDKGTTEEFRSRLSEMSEIPTEFLEVYQTRKSFPNELSVLNLHMDPEWTSNKSATSSDKWSSDCYDDGCVYLYRDSREELKQLTPEERKELTQKETARFRGVRDKVCSPRRERGLKIYLDSNKKDEDTSPDNSIINNTAQKTTDQV